MKAVGVAQAVAPQAPVAAPTPQPPLNACRAAIARHWPKELHEQAFTALNRENGLETPNRKGSVNSDGSQDFGCMQINNKAHPEFFATQDWSNADHNASYGFQIYKSRGNWSAWYAVKGILW